MYTGWGQDTELYDWVRYNTLNGNMIEAFLVTEQKATRIEAKSFVKRNRRNFV